MKRTVMSTIILGLATTMAAPALAGSREHGDDEYRQQRYVPAGGDLVEWLFGGPRYYDKRMITTSAEPCAYQRVGPDANAANVVNDHYCGK